VNDAKGDSLLWVGRVVKTQGIRGQMRISSGDAGTFSKGKNIYVEDDQGGKRAFTVESSRVHKETIVLSLEGVTRIEEAEKLVGCSVYVGKDDLAPLPSDEFYWYQLRGLAVKTEEGAFLGNVEEIFPTGSNDVLVVKNGGKEILIPATDEAVVRVDLREKVMIIRLLEGLLPEDDF
jgi:16S rRNA processing protein RimM